MPLTPAQEIALQADRCVLCGMCLPYCPTYRLFGSEPESPRGRIALAAALARGALPPTPTLAAHLNSCLTCRSCERHCPSGVSYGSLIDAARQLLHEAGLGPAAKGRQLLTPGGPQEALRKAIRIYDGSPLQRWLRGNGLLGTGRLARLESMLPEGAANAPLAARYSSHGQERGQIYLFVGCSGELMEPETLRAAVTLLTQAGYSVQVPPATCCGALDQHAGDAKRASRRVAETLEAYPGDEPIIAVGSACAASLCEYGERLGTREARQFSQRVREVTRFLADQPVLPAPESLPSGTVAVHVPCSQRNSLRDPGAAGALLSRFGIPTTELPNADGCCGAAGEYLLTAPVVADRLRQPLIEALAAANTRYLVSANVGCARHIAAGARSAELTVEVLHPVALVARLIEPGATQPLNAAT